MDELQQLKTLLNPVEILFVADAMTYEDAVKSADEFHKKLGITGVILTKMDGDAQARRPFHSFSPALPAAEASSVLAKNRTPLRPFHPDAASRILGMGDIVSFVEKAQESTSTASSRTGDAA